MSTQHLPGAELVFICLAGAGTDGLPLKSLFGFERIHVKAGATVSVFLYPALTELTRTTITGERQALPGEYQVSFGVESSQHFGMGYTMAKLVSS